MKIILSRKGFDSGNGGCPSPILPDGTMLSMPIPTDGDIGIAYNAISFKGCSYAKYLRQLNSKKEYKNCHLDPDIRPDVRITPVENWKPAFGQTGKPQGILRNAGIQKDDIFLFFGRYQQTEQDMNGNLKFKEDAKPIHVIYGYLQIGEILNNYNDISDYYWNPHAESQYKGDKSNTLYVPRDRLTFAPSKSGSGVFNYSQNRQLTMEGEKMATWNIKDFYMPEHVYGNRKNSANNGGLFYAGVWQELVLDNFENKAFEWVKTIILG